MKLSPIVLVGLSLTLIGCKGPKGDQGAAGLQGLQGGNGSNGAGVEVLVGNVSGNSQAVPDTRFRDAEQVVIYLKTGANLNQLPYQTAYFDWNKSAGTVTIYNAQTVGADGFVIAITLD